MYSILFFKFLINLFSLKNSGASGSATSVDLGDLPFDMPKLRRRLRVGGVNLNIPPHISNNQANNALNNNILSTDTSGVSQASSSQSMQHQDDRPIIGKLSNCNYDVMSLLFRPLIVLLMTKNFIFAPWLNKKSCLGLKFQLFKK